MNDMFLRAALIGDVWILYLLIAASIVSVAVMIGRARVFSRNAPKDIRDLSRSLQDALERGDEPAALRIARASSSVEGRVLALGLEHLDKGPGAVEELMVAAVLQERTELEKHLIILGTLGNNAPFIGLFGTVLGIIKAFNDLAVNGGGNTSVVMAGIASALIATALGIFVAIPAVMANNYFLDRIKRTVSGTESLIRLLLAHMKDARKGGRRAVAR